MLARRLDSELEELVDKKESMAMRPTLIENSITAPREFVASAVRCGLKKTGEDLAIIYSQRPAVAAAVFTTNIVQAAPILVSRAHLKNARHRAILVNSGGANACTGEPGYADAKRSAELVASRLGCDPEEILIASTGVIGVRLDMTKIEAGIREATNNLNRDNGSRVAEAIMTTDTRPKRSFRRLRLGRREVVIAGVAKGAGMIHPNMATLLSFITTDAAISKRALKTALKRAVEKSFNRISVDGDTSTNDTLAIMANGAAENPLISSTASKDFGIFERSLTEVATELAIEVARDGEGARKLVTIEIRRAPSLKAAELIAKAIATSPLVKTAVAGEDANWGRILAAAGRSGARFDPSKVDICIGDLKVAQRGTGLRFDEGRARKILSSNEITILFDMRQGNNSLTGWTCDMTEGYIRINADYRS